MFDNKCDGSYVARPPKAECRKGDAGQMLNLWRLLQLWHLWRM
jgi:hypothetical protein